MSKTPPPLLPNIWYNEEHYEIALLGGWRFYVTISFFSPHYHEKFQIGRKGAGVQNIPSAAMQSKCFQPF